MPSSSVSRRDEIIKHYFALSRFVAVPIENSDLNIFPLNLAVVPISDRREMAL